MKKQKKIRGKSTHPYNKVALVKELEETIQIIKDEWHNNGMNGAAVSLRKKRLEEMTSAELKFMHIAQLKGLKLIPQYLINIYSKNRYRIDRFYFTDFCDPKNHIVFEIDGEYHFTKEQAKKDKQRTKDLSKAGYKVFRITNEEVFAGKTTEFLYKTYMSLGLDLKKLK